MPLLKFSHEISQSKGFLTIASFIQPGSLTHQRKKELQKETANELLSQNIQAFVRINEANTSMAGMQQMIEYYGLGPLQPNTILLGGIKKENETGEFARFMQSAFDRHYNIIIMDGECGIPKANPASRREIHLWWDNFNLDNSELMLVLAYMLQGNAGRKHKRIFLKAIVEDELQKKIKLEQFQKLSIDKRLPIEADVYVSSNGQRERFDMVREFSKDAEIVLMGLLAPPKEEDSFNDYVGYLHRISESLAGMPSLVFVLSSENIPLNVILQ